MFHSIFVLWNDNLRVIRIASVISIILGWLLDAYAWTLAPPHPVNTICLFAGVLMFCAGGFILILTAIFRKKRTRETIEPKN
jgi:hypothetical protein